VFVKDNPLVSVIIPTRNASTNIRRCLDSIINQTYKNIEIIVVDNYSTDNTTNIAAEYTDKIFTSGPERSAQVNYGAHRASGKYVYRVDSDFILDGNLIKQAVTVSELNNYAAILIHNTSDPTVSYWSKVRKFERDMYISDETNVAVRFIRRDVFISLGGLDPRLLIGEDYDLHNRIIRTYKIGRITSKEIHLGEYKTLWDIAQLHYIYGKTVYSFVKKNKIRGMKQMNPFRKAFIKNYKEFFKHPYLATGFIVYQIVKFSSGGLGLLVHMLQKLYGRN
jgi:glycosyltransferase involved in cell wall biosynthesis